MPNMKLSIYKNRGGSLNKFYLWINADKDICRYNGVFATSYSYDWIPISDTIIKVEEV